MTLSRIINRPCTIIHNTASGSIDELGDATKTQTLTTTVCEVQQARREEAPGEWSKAEWRGFFPAGTMFDTGDQIEVDSLGRFAVIGAPWPARNPRTQAESHVEATLDMTAGAGDAS